MPVQPFHGETFVAFMDISGFTGMLAGDSRRALGALDVFYQAGYSVLGAAANNDRRVDGIFVSDCGILFVPGANSSVAKLKALLEAMEAIHRSVFEEAIQLTSSVAWGSFHYHDRIEFVGIDKTPLHGHAYLSAYRDNASGQPKLHPSESRILKQDLPDEVKTFLAGNEHPITRKCREETAHYYFEWMRPHGRMPHRPQPDVTMG